MKKLIYTIFFLSIISCKGQVGENSSQYYSYNPDNFNFSINFQKKPVENHTVQSNIFGQMEINRAYSENKSDQMAFAIIYSKYLKEDLEQLKPSLKEFYDNAERQGAEMVSGKVVISQSFEIDGLEGREVRISMRDGELLMTSRMLLNDTEFYIWSSTYLKNNEWNKKKTDFLNGLEINKK
ncbi:hypothetical protein GCM10007103_14710 [Salinimicrobium marinum]|uniref:Uncharacterized protein n=1 Tax=Salinimicrobium marinum TaxID=680283 RepID=A0A918SD65_9FLAO|nr:hypothetical protein [Salinimicrobium marinum]GHA34358.1 hypothetical protein GCM10007103_14710 [Salinimicrobium marinum]